MCENFVTHTLTHTCPHTHGHTCAARGYKMKLYFVAGKEGGRGGWKKEVKSATKTEREMSYFSTLPAGDYGNAMPGHWYSCCCCCCCSHSSLLLRIIIIISDGHLSRACARRSPPATRLCRFHFIIVITLCHNLFCPHISHVHMMRERRHYYYAISVPKTGPISLARLCNLPTFLCHLCGKLLS